jgi:hypothetical protein
MISRKIFVVILVLALVTMACGVNVNLPLRDIKTGPTQTEEIRVPGLADPSQVAQVTLGFGAGELKISPGAGSDLVSGIATYNVEDLRPEVSVEGDNVNVDTGDLSIEGIPSFNRDFINEWDLQLGEGAMELIINAGAYKGSLDLGGLALQSLEVNDGASDVDLTFSEPNSGEMGTFLYKTGASNVELRDLANANFEVMTFKSGAGDYTLDFSGELKRDATITLDAGLSNVTVIVPQGVSARVLFDGGLTNVDISGDWEKDGSQYVLDGSGPQLTFNVNMGAGQLELRN